MYQLLYQKLLYFTYKLEQNRLFVAIRSGLMFLIPILITGSIALTIKTFPIPAFTSFLECAAGGMILEVLNFIYDATFGLMSVYLCCGISYFYASSCDQTSESFRLMSMITSMGCFLISFGAPAGAFRFADFGALGIASAIFCALAATSLFHQFYKRLPRIFHSYAAGVDEQFRTVLAMILPLALVLILFSLGIEVIQAVTGKQNLNYVLSGLVIRLFQSLSNELLSGIVFVLLLNSLWFFGMHGGNIMEQVAQYFFAPSDLDPSVIVSKSFLDNFVMIGGSGTALCLLLALLLFSKNDSSRKLAWCSAPFAVFNMSELLVFGFPAILNPMLLIPFLLTPVLSLCIAYGATAIGFLPVVNETIIWSTPVLFSGYAATNSVRGIVVQLITLFAGAFLYAPFIRLSEYLHAGHERLLVDEFSKVFWKEYDTAGSGRYMGRSNQIGVIAKSMASQLRDDIRIGRIPVYFQPQFNSAHEIVGAETLLRWKYHGIPVAPPIVCQLAQEDGLFDELTRVILERAAVSMTHFKEQVQPGFSLSVNVSASQVDDPAFIEHVIDLVKQSEISGNFGLEIIEDDSLERYDHIEPHLLQLKAAGIHASIDDFSMGRTSIKYLQNNDFQYVKLDGELVRRLPGNQRSQDIVRSIISLGNDLGFEVIAEYVENEELRDLLEQLGCHIFQGYLYSPAVSESDFWEMLIK